MMKNKNLLITGAATRVGKAVALHFSKKGWNIALHYFRSSAKAKKLKKIIEQNFVKDPDKTIQDLLNDTISTLGENIEIKRFSRFQLGELSKSEEDSD